MEDDDSSDSSDDDTVSLPAKDPLDLYQKLIRPQTKDVANVSKTEVLRQAEPTNVFEMNNKLIAEAYAVSKRREYVQRHIGEVDMEILDGGISADTAA